MGLRFDIKLDSSEINRALKGLDRNIKFATANAINSTLYTTMRLHRKRLPMVFDKPTRWITKGVFYKRAHPTRGKMHGFVGFKNWFDHGGSLTGLDAERVMKPHVYGGFRYQKPGEKAMQAKGLMGGRMYYGPSRRVSRDRHGNVTGGMMQKILSGVKAQRDPQRNTKSGSKYFVFKKGGRPIGVYERMAKGIKPLIYFTRPPYYRQRYNFHQISKLSIERWFPRMVTKAIIDEFYRIRGKSFTAPTSFMKAA